MNDIPIEVEKQIVENQALYHRVFGSTDGQAVMKDLEKRCYVNHTTFGVGAHDNYGSMAFAEGRRSVYMHIKNLLDRDLKAVLESLTKKEQHNG